MKAKPSDKRYEAEGRIGKQGSSRERATDAMSAWQGVLTTSAGLRSTALDPRRLGFPLAGVNDAASQQPGDGPMVSGKPLRRRIAPYRIASGNGPIDRAKIGCAFGVLKAVCWISALASERLKADLDVASIVSNKQKFAFCGIPKVATGSMRLALFDLPQIEPFFVKRRVAVLAAEGSPYQSYYKFSFVRNPWSRVVSCYRDKIQRSLTIGKLQIMAKHPGLSPGLPFDAFVEWLCSPEGSDQCADRHWMSQHKFITDDTGRIVCDFIGKLENIDTDLKTICEAICLPPIEIPHRNKTSHDQGPGSYRNLYDDRTRKLIGQRYERDVDTFKYIF